MSLFFDINTWDVGKTLLFSRILPTSRVFISENRDMLNVFYCLNRELRCVVQYGELRWHLSTCLGETKSLSIVTASVIHFLYEWLANRYKRPGSERFNPRLCNLALLLIRSLCDMVLLLYMKVYNTILFNVESTRSGCPPEPGAQVKMLDNESFSFQCQSLRSHFDFPQQDGGEICQMALQKSTFLALYHKHKPLLIFQRSPNITRCIYASEYPSKPCYYISPTNEIEFLLIIAATNSFYQVFQSILL